MLAVGKYPNGRGSIESLGQGIGCVKSRLRVLPAEGVPAAPASGRASRRIGRARSPAPAATGEGRTTLKMIAVVPESHRQTVSPGPVLRIVRLPADGDGAAAPWMRDFRPAQWQSAGQVIDAGIAKGTVEDVFSRECGGALPSIPRQEKRGISEPEDKVFHIARTGTWARGRREDG